MQKYITSTYRVIHISFTQHCFKGEGIFVTRLYVKMVCEREENKAEELTALLEDILALLCGTPPSLEKKPDENAQLLE